MGTRGRNVLTGLALVLGLTLVAAGALAMLDAGDLARRAGDGMVAILPWLGLLTALLGAGLLYYAVRGLYATFSRS